MLTRLHIQNYRAIADVRLEFRAQNLLMGRNGAGKTSAFDVIAAIRELVVEGEKCEEVFPIDGIPRWIKGDKPHVFEQRFEVEFEGDLGVVAYALVVEQDERLGRSRVFSEVLSADGKPLFAFREGKVQHFRDADHSEGKQYTLEWDRSALKIVPPEPDDWRLKWFMERMRGVECVRIDAPKMGWLSRSEREARRLERDLSNFPSWYRRVLVANASAGAAYLGDLRDVIDGMQSLDLYELGQGLMELRASFERPVRLPSRAGRKAPRTYWVGFNELSDGQRALIGLYALRHFLVKENTTLCIDEPDNFVALAEIQPWLIGVQDRVQDLGAQVLMASHHPELLDFLATDCGILLERENSGLTTARPYAADPGSTLKPAERVARGWERE